MREAFLGTDYWRRHVEQCARSGLSQAAYCREHGLAVSKFGYWHRKLAAVKTSDWLPVEITSVPTNVATIDLVLAGDRCLRIAVGFDEGLLRQVILAVEATP
jgi:hypothetical protein